MASNPTVRLPANGHSVHFYEHDDDLSARVVDFIRLALGEGDSAVIIATPAHRASFADGLARTGADLDAARADGSLIELDAAGTLAQITVAGSMDPARFEQAVGARIRSAAARGRGVCAYGEMVALLWEAGSVGSAVELEGVWNDFREHVPITLFCGYPNWLTETEDSASVFDDVCAAHSHVVAAAPSADSADATRRFPRSPAAPAQARHFVREWLTARGHWHVIETAQLAVSELATNAVTHARSDFTVSLDQSAEAVRIVVGDTSTDPPQRRQASEISPRGRGLSIVWALTSATGHVLVDGGKLVWADVAIAR